MDYDRSALAHTIGSAVQTHFLNLIPLKTDAATVRQHMIEALRVSGMAVAVLLPGFRDDPELHLQEWERDIEEKADEVMRLIMRPGSRIWRHLE